MATEDNPLELKGSDISEKASHLMEINYISGVLSCHLSNIMFSEIQYSLCMLSAPLQVLVCTSAEQDIKVDWEVFRACYERRAGIACGVRNFRHRA